MSKENRIWIVFVFAMYWLNISCEKEPAVQPFNTNDEKNRTIKVTIHHVIDSIFFIDTIVPETEVRLYSDHDQFITDGNYDAIGNTDSAGVALFEFRDDAYYWIRCYHPAHGFVSDSVNTPPHTISFVEIYYYF